MTQRISFEQYGEIPERMKVCHEAEKLEANIKHFTDKNPKDKYADFNRLIKLRLRLNSNDPRSRKLDRILWGKAQESSEFA